MNKNERIAQAEKEGLKHHGPYERALEAMAHVRLQRAIEYGESRYEEEDHDFNMGGVFWDIYRKFIRLRQQFKRGWRHPSLRETFLDLGNYSAMGLQLYDQYTRAAGSEVARVVEEATGSRFRIEQVAFFAESPTHMMTWMEKILGLKRWVRDIVVAQGHVRTYNGDVTNKAELWFNYELGPFELELIKYLDGPNWLEVRGANLNSGLSHLGLHIAPSVNLGRIEYRLLKEVDIRIAQKVITQKHENPAIAGKRRYMYVVFDTYRFIGFDLKLIRRLNENGTVYET